MSDPLALLEERVNTLRHIPTPILMDALWVKVRGYIRGAGPLSPGTQMVCMAGTMPFVTFRSDLNVGQGQERGI